MPTLNVVTPLIPAGASLDKALEFYTKSMGFACSYRSGKMAGIERDGIAFNLVENIERSWGENASFSIGVTGLDALYDEYRRFPIPVGSRDESMGPPRIPYDRRRIWRVLSVL